MVGLRWKLFFTIYWSALGCLIICKLNVPHSEALIADIHCNLPQSQTQICGSSDGDDWRLAVAAGRRTTRRSPTPATAAPPRLRTMYSVGWGEIINFWIWQFFIIQHRFINSVRPSYSQTLTRITCLLHVQGDHSGCAKPLVDIKIKVLF